MEDNRYFLNQVLQRYDPGLHQRTNSFYTQLHLGGLDKEFIFAIVNAFDETTFNASDFDPFPIEMVIDYIQKTHRFYLQKSLPEIKQTILTLSGEYPSGHPLIHSLQNFFRGYDQDLKIHFACEEKKLLPYIVRLREAETAADQWSGFTLLNGKYSIARFLDEHDDTEAELSVMSDAMLLHHPPAANTITYRALLTQLRMLEKDLHIHALMEEMVLIPKALKIEVLLTEQLRRKASLN